MYKNLTTLIIILLFPALAFAQDDNNIIKEFAKRVVDLQSVRINEHLNVLQIGYDDNVFELVGINDRMQVLWRDSFKGHPFQSAKFKGNVITIASTENNEHNLNIGVNNTYNAFLVDVSNGNLIAQNQIFTNANTYRQFPEMYTGDGSFCKIIVRQSQLKRRVLFFDVFSFDNTNIEKNTTTDLHAFELNDKLEVVNSFQPEISAGTYINSAVNDKGDLFISWLNGTGLEVYKYEEGKTVSSKKLSLDVPIIDKKGERFSIDFIRSEEDPDIVYSAMIYRNNKDKSPELNVGKFDFSSGNTHSITENFTKKDLKTLEKSFVRVNKKIDDPELALYYLELKYVKETNGKLVVALAANDEGWHYGTSLKIDFAILINGYDPDLNQKFQQLMPVKSENPYIKLYNGFNIANDKLYIVSNYTSGTFNMHGQALGIMDLNTGSWDKMEILSKKHINNSDFSDGNGVMWFDSNCIVPYCNPNSLVSLIRSEITLQQNQY